MDKKLEEMIRKDTFLNKQLQLATSVPGIGRTTAMALLIATAGFTRFDNAKQIHRSTLNN
ncbi:transposase [Algivirga pacifica]|uniref:Transposase IS116/IS110/IS902 C-terminal domain-containing protein n=1 Tax=Algivirga pacifica TaxID=1162670 RepID=A0ABP9CZZ2_9BACT